MKTYKEFLVEVKHSLISYTRWGIVTKDGIVGGNDHPTAKTHGDLLKAHGYPDAVEYFHHEPSNSLCIRTFSTKGLGLAIKHFNQLPHDKTGMVHHDHIDGSYDHDDNPIHGDNYGKRYQVLPKMKALHAKLIGGSLTEMAQDPHKAGYQFHLLHDWSGKGVHAVVATHPSATPETGNWGSLVPSVISKMSDMKAAIPKTVQGHVVGYAEIQHKDGPHKDSADMLYVSPAHRRKGVAAGLYDKYQEYTGRQVKPSIDQTGAARSFWKDRRSIK